LIDLAVYHQTEVLRNEVFLDFTTDPLRFKLQDLDSLPKDFLEKSCALMNVPFNRLEKLNPIAIEIFKDHGIDLRERPIPIQVSNQHMNGGMACDKWWQSENVLNLYAIGELNGSHGITRPGGSALNAGQVGGLRVAQKIMAQKGSDSYTLKHFNFNSIAERHLKKLTSELERLLDDNEMTIDQ
jgi:succinate dehydrogenase/fumarate reductase flavoprotein subunit